MLKTDTHSNIFLQGTFKTIPVKKNYPQTSFVQKLNKQKYWFQQKFNQGATFRLNDSKNNCQEHNVDFMLNRLKHKLEYQFKNSSSNSTGLTRKSKSLRSIHKSSSCEKPDLKNKCFSLSKNNLPNKNPISRYKYPNPLSHNLKLTRLQIKPKLKLKLNFECKRQKCKNQIQHNNNQRSHLYIQNMQKKIGFQQLYTIDVNQISSICHNSDYQMNYLQGPFKQITLNDQITSNYNQKLKRYQNGEQIMLNMNQWRIGKSTKSIKVQKQTNSLFQEYNFDQNNLPRPHQLKYVMKSIKEVKQRLKLFK